MPNFKYKYRLEFLGSDNVWHKVGEPYSEDFMPVIEKAKAHRQAGNYPYGLRVIAVRESVFWSDQ